jgi:uncharacterized protein YqjF (DUF2071 family)
MTFQPVYPIRIRVVVVTNDNEPSQPDFSSTAYPNFDGEIMEGLVYTASEVWSQAGITLLYEPNVDVMDVANTRLNQDHLPGDTEGTDGRELTDSDKARQAFAEQYPGRLVVFIREGVAPGYTHYCGANYIAISKADVTDDFTLATQLGYYFGLPATSGNFRNVQELKDHIINAFPDGAPPVAVVRFLDADATDAFGNAFILDTPADPGAAVYQDVYQYTPGDYESFSQKPQSLWVEVTFPSGKQQTFPFVPLVDNIMSNFPHDTEKTYLTPGQIFYVRDKLENGELRSLIVPRWQLLGGHATTTPTVVSWGDQRLDIFASGKDAKVYHIAYDHKVWYPSDQLNAWDNLGRPMKGLISAVAWRPNRLDITVTGPDNNVYHKAYEDGTWFPSVNPDEWDLIGGTTSEAPAVASWGQQRLDIFVRGMDRQLYHKAYDNGTWYPSAGPSSWDLLGGLMIGPPVAVSWGPNRVDVFIQGLDTAVFHRAWDNGAWQAWDFLGSLIIGTPSVVCWAPGRMDITVSGRDGRVYHKAYDNGKWLPSDNPNHWDLLGGHTTDIPATTTWGKGRLDVVIRGTDGCVYHKAYDNGKWLPSDNPDDWTNLGGNTVGAPSIATWGKDHLCVSAVSATDKTIIQKTWNGYYWTP